VDEALRVQDISLFPFVGRRMKTSSINLLLLISVNHGHAVFEDDIESVSVEVS